MEFFEVVQRRQSVRQFKASPVEWGDLRNILESANRAPSAGNLQAYQIVVVKEAWERQLLARATGDQAHVAEAPVALVFCTDPKQSAKQYGARGEQLYCVQDATIACAYAQLAATALGLDSVWVGTVLEPEVVRLALGLGDSLWPIAILLIGHAAEVPARTPRRTLADLVSGLHPDDAKKLKDQQP
jgi:nitroreductase